MVGLDNESRMITLAQHAIAERELRNVTLLQADAYRRLPALLRRAGMADVDVRAHQHIWRPGDLYHSLLIQFVGIHRKRIIDGGYLTSERIDELTAELEQHLAQPETLVIYTPLFQAWGRKPTINL